MENAIYEGCDIPWSYVDPENSFAFLVAGSDLMKYGICVRVRCSFSKPISLPDSGELEKKPLAADKDANVPSNHKNSKDIDGMTENVDLQHNKEIIQIG